VRSKGLSFRIPHSFAEAHIRLVLTEVVPAMDTIQGNVTGRKDLSPEPLPASIALAYRINDAVRISGLSRSSIYVLMSENKLESIKVAGRRLIPAAALRDLLQGTA
jgi:hypothetical protein